MAAKGFAQSDKANRWEVLITNGKEHVAEVPHIAEDLNLLEIKSAEARVLISRGDDLKAQAQENTRKLRELVQEGEKIRARVGLNLQARYGIFNEKLVKFGFQPRREARRKADSGEDTKAKNAKQEAASAG
jgi:hypothetical protein